MTFDDLTLGWRKVVSPAAVRAFRQRRGWTHEQMADAVGAMPLEVAAWEAGAVRVPAEQAGRMREISEESVLRLVPFLPPPSCAWADAHAPGLHSILQHEPAEVRNNLPVQRHLAECPVCRAVYELGRAPSARSPLQDPGLEGPIVSFGRALDGMPRILLLPLLVGGGFLALMPLLWLLVRLFSLLPDWPHAEEVQELVLALTGAWASFHVAQAVTPLPVRRRNPYATSLLASVAAVLAGMLAWNAQAPEAGLLGPLGLAGGTVVALVTGVLTGRARAAAWEDAQDAESGDTAPGPGPLLGEGDSLAGLDEVREGPHPGRAAAPAR